MVNVTDAQLPVGGQTYTSSDRWSVPLLAWMKDRPVWDLGRKFGIWPSPSTDQSAKILEARDAAISAGGAHLRFSRPGYYLLDTAQVEDGFTVALPWTADNTVIDGVPGVILKTELASPTLMFQLNGAAKFAGFANWRTHWAVNNTVLDLDTAEVFLRGTRRVKTATAADAGAFSPGDDIFIRSGHMLNAPFDDDEQPGAELNIVEDADDTTGWITLRYGLAHTYQLEHYISGSSGRTEVGGAGDPSIFGVANLAGKVLKNVHIRNLHLEVENHGASIWHEQVMGFSVQGVTFDLWDDFTIGNNSRFGLMRDCHGSSRIVATGLTTDFAWLGGTGTGSCDLTYADSSIHVPYSIPQIHVKERTADVHIVRVTAIGAPDVASEIDTVSIRSRAEYVSVRGCKFYHSGGTQPVIYVEDNCGPGSITDCEIGGTNGTGHHAGVRINPASGWEFRRNTMRDDLLVFSTPATLRDTPPIKVNADEMADIAASGATRVTAVSRWAAWSLPATGTPEIGAIVRVPDDWLGSPVHLRVRTVKLTANSGDVRMQMRTSVVEVGASLNVTTATAAQTVVPEAQNSLGEYTTALFFLPAAAGGEYLIRISRDSAHAADTLDGAVGILSVTLEPTNV